MQRGMQPRRPLGDVRGQNKGERLSEYFDFAADPEKRTRKVTREELLAILTRKWMVERDLRWYRRLWKFLRAPWGSKMVPVGGGVKDEAKAE